MCVWLLCTPYPYPLPFLNPSSPCVLSPNSLKTQACPFLLLNFTHAGSFPVFLPESEKPFSFSSLLNEGSLCKNRCSVNVFCRIWSLRGSRSVQKFPTHICSKSSCWETLSDRLGYFKKARMRPPTWKKQRSAKLPGNFSDWQNYL